MGILDQVSGALGGGKGGGVQGALLQQLVSYLSKPGAMSNLTAAFERNGLGDVLQSWVGKGENRSISSSQLEQVLGRDVVSDMAAKAGVGESEAANQISSMLPELIDRASPDGAAPSSNAFGGLLSKASGLFQGRDTH